MVLPYSIQSLLLEGSRRRVVQKVYRTRALIEIKSRGAGLLRVPEGANRTKRWTPDAKAPEDRCSWIINISSGPLGRRRTTILGCSVYRRRCSKDFSTFYKMYVARAVCNAIFPIDPTARRRAGPCAVKASGRRRIIKLPHCRTLKIHCSKFRVHR